MSNGYSPTHTGRTGQIKVLAYTTALSQYTVVVKALRGRCRQREGNVLVDGMGRS